MNDKKKTEELWVQSTKLSNDSSKACPSCKTETAGMLTRTQGNIPAIWTTFNLLYIQLQK